MMSPERSSASGSGGDACSPPAPTTRRRSSSTAAHTTSSGVMPDGFAPTLVASDVWVLLHATEDPAKANLRIMNGLGRLRPGVDAPQAQRALEPISAALARDYPAGYRELRPRVAPLRDELFGSTR